MAYLGAGLDAVNETLSTINMVCDTMTGNGVLTTKVLGSPTAPGSVNNVSVYYDGVAQTPTTDYTLSGSTITFSEAPASNVNVVILSYADEFSKTISDNTVYTDVIEDSAIANNKILGISASKLTGTLPALDGSALTGVVTLDPVLINETSNPTVSSMLATGNGVGTIWVNSTTGAMFICTDATVGANVWLNVGEGSGHRPLGFMSATGGSISTVGNFKIHTFTSSGTFEVTSAGIGLSETLIVAGGGGGGVSGGGAGGHLVGGVFTELLNLNSYPVVVGAGGPFKNNSSFTKEYSNGGDSTFGGLGAIGGGGSIWGHTTGNDGGSGGGGGYNGGPANRQPGAGIPGQGNNGGHGGHTGGSGGGGGAGSTGFPSTASSGGNGGAGLANSITGTAVTRAGGGGGGSSGTDGTGGSGGGGDADGGAAGFAPANTGSGGGGAYNSGGGNGGSGIVIIRYQFQ